MNHGEPRVLSYQRRPNRPSRPARGPVILISAAIVAGTCLLALVMAFRGMIAPVSPRESVAAAMFAGLAGGILVLEFLAVVLRSSAATIARAFACSRISIHS